MITFSLQLLPTYRLQIASNKLKSGREKRIQFPGALHARYLSTLNYTQAAHKTFKVIFDRPYCKNLYMLLFKEFMLFFKEFTKSSDDILLNRKKHSYMTHFISLPES